MVKSVDPDQTTSVTERTNKALDDVDLQEGMEDEDEDVEEYGDRWGETTSAAPVILEESGTLPTHTGTIDYFTWTQGAVCWWTVVQAHGPNLQMSQLSGYLHHTSMCSFSSMFVASHLSFSCTGTHQNMLSHFYQGHVLKERRVNHVVMVVGHV